MDTKNKILEVIKTPQLAGFATLNEEGKPWVRYVMSTGRDDMTIRFGTFVNARKVKQIIANPEVHLTMGVQDPTKMAPYVQIQGKATLTTNQDEKTALWDPACEKIFQGPEDPNYGVIIVTPYRVELMDVGQFEPQVWTA